MYESFDKLENELVIDIDDLFFNCDDLDNKDDIYTSSY